MGEPIPGLLMIFMGIFIFLSIGYKWKPIFNHPKVEFFFKLFGNRGATILYFVVATLCIVYGIVLMIRFD